jgi:hypothetical protein
MDELVETSTQSVVCDANGAPKPAQTRRGRVQELAGRVEASTQDAAQARQWMDLSGQLPQQRPSLAAQGIAEPRGGVQRHGDVEEVPRLQSAASRRAFHPGPDVLAAADTGSRVVGDEGARLCRLGEASSHDHGLGTGLERLGESPAGRETGRGCKPSPNERVFEESEGATIETGGTRGRT